MKTFLTLVLLLAVTSLATAQESHLPHETDFKTDVCLQCGMKVTSPSYAAQIALADKGLFFDDIGCLVQYARAGKVKAQDIQAQYVRTVAGDAWIDVTKAVWVQTKDVRTPMNYGYHAFADNTSAEVFAKGKKMAKVVTWKELTMASFAPMGKM